MSFVGDERGREKYPNGEPEVGKERGPHLRRFARCRRRRGREPHIFSWRFLGALPGQSAGTKHPRNAKPPIPIITLQSLACLDHGRPLGGSRERAGLVIEVAARQVSLVLRGGGACKVPVPLPPIGVLSGAVYRPPRYRTVVATPERAASTSNPAPPGLPRVLSSGPSENEMLESLRVSPQRLDNWMICQFPISTIGCGAEWSAGVRRIGLTAMQKEWLSAFAPSFSLPHQPPKQSLVQTLYIQVHPSSSRRSFAGLLVA